MEGMSSDHASCGRNIASALAELVKGWRLARDHLVTRPKESTVGEGRIGRSCSSLSRRPTPGKTCLSLTSRTVSSRRQKPPFTRTIGPQSGVLTGGQSCASNEAIATKDCRRVGTDGGRARLADCRHLAVRARAQRPEWKGAFNASEDSSDSETGGAYHGGRCSRAPGGRCRDRVRSRVACFAGARSTRSWVVPCRLECSGSHGVSCTSSRFCLAVGGPVAKRWNGSSWSAVPVPPGLRFATVSCRAVHGCAAGGATNSAYAPGWWNGRSWATRIIADTSGYDPQSEGPGITGISCTWVKFCVAIGGDGANAPVAFQWNGRRWISRSNGALDTYHYGFPGPISCAATNACTAVDSNSGSGTYSYFFNGSRWSLSGTLPEANVSESTADTVNGVSCVSARACMAVGVVSGEGTLYAANSF